MINEERWYTLSYAQQMGHIGSEITRARIWEDKHDAIARNKALERSLILMDITKNDGRLYKRRRELCYLRDMVADQYAHAGIYAGSLKDLEKYCLDFALVANKDR